MRRVLFALPAAALLAGCVGTPADSPMEPMVQQARTPTLLPPSSDAQYGVPAPLYDRIQSLPMAGMSSVTSVVIDFEALAASGESFTFVPTYSEDGFTIANPSESGAPDAFGSPQSGNSDYYQGSTTLVNNYPMTAAVLTKDDGGTFDAVSIDLAEIITTGQSAEVPFIGTRADGSTVEVTFTTDGLEGFQTFIFEGFTGLVSLSWDQLPQYHQFDNIVLSVGSTDPGPEPKGGTGTQEDKTSCMKGGWEQLGFKNQGQCIRFVETGKDSR